ncbi:MAG: DrmE family protein [Clostridia bacterium]|nr:DrmE family protein [Clostridia bacterium]
MLSWNEYIKELLSTKTVLDDMYLQNGNTTVSPIVKASIQMLESMIETEGPHNVFVFPEIKELLYEFVISKIVFNVSAGKININYDPHSFQKGQKLKYKNCIVKFNRYVENDFDGKERIYIEFADGGTRGLPPKIAPIFQIVDSETKRFSKEKAFDEVYSAQEALEELESITKHCNIVENLKDYKTHLDGSIFLVTNMRNAKEYFDQALINGTPMKDVLLIGKVQGDGSVDSCYAGQLSGNPAIVLVNDLYSIQKAIEHGARAQSVIINSSYGNIIENQLDVLDELSSESFPILCLTDTNNSFNLDVLFDRCYNIWRWNEKSLVDEIHTSGLKTAGYRIKNCAVQKLTYEKVSSLEISEALQSLYAHKNTIEEQGTNVIATYNKLFSLLFTSLRSAIPFEREEQFRVQNVLYECEFVLNQSKRFMSQSLYNDLMKVITCYEKVFTMTFENPKVLKMSEIISSKKYSSVCIVITDRMDKVKCEEYWRNYAVRKHSPTVIKVLYPQEYANFNAVKYDATIIVGWLNSKNMRNIIYSYGTAEYIVLTYDCEEKWKKAHTRVWNKALANSSNKNIVKNSFSKTAQVEISDERFVEKSAMVHEDTFDELTDIEALIQRNMYKQYGVSNNGQNQVVEAYPINFVGGNLSLYRTGHKIVTVTDIVVDGKENVSLRTPDELQIGDFVVEREAQRDIIKDIADKILERSGMSDARTIAMRWKESLNVETAFASLDVIYHNLKLHGCSREYQTVRNWIENEDQFSLSSKEDLICIAKTLDDELLLESIDEVYVAGQNVKRAHVMAGQYLSRKLRVQIAERISEYGEIDPFNIWDPIELQIEDIGKVIILKIIDINRPIFVDMGNTNRLLSE